MLTPTYSSLVVLGVPGHAHTLTLALSFVGLHTLKVTSIPQNCKKIIVFRHTSVLLPRLYLCSVAN